MTLKRLSSLKENEQGKITKIDAGQGLRMRLIAMGATPNSPVRMIRNQGRGPVVVEIREGSRIILGRGMAEKIMVRKD